MMGGQLQRLVLEFRTGELVVRAVVAEQYADLGEESYAYIADGWIETLREWTRLDWLVKAGREGPPDA